MSLHQRVMQWMQEPIRPVVMPSGTQRPRIPRGPTISKRVAAETAALPVTTSEVAQTAWMARVASWTNEVFHYWRPQIIEVAERLRRHRCPHCGSHEFRRSRPRSVEWLAGMARIFPYRCYSCNRRFFGLSLVSNPFEEHPPTCTY